MEDSIKSESRFNYALAKLERLHMIHIAIHNARMQQNYPMIQCNLWSLRNELHERMDKDQIGKSDEYENLMNGEIVKFKSSQMYSFLPFMQYERFLFELEKQFGISLPDKDEDDDGL